MHKNDRILKLEKNIIAARDDYYNTDTPLVSDEIYDTWIDELKLLDSTNILLSHIGAIVVDNSNWEKAKHDIPMGSLDKLNTPDEIIDWCKKKNSGKLLAMDKLDGLSINVIYKNGKFVSAITRGNGYEGELIGRNVSKMNGIKDTLSINFSGSFRGEIILRRSNHQKYFPNYSNPRNAASGISKRLDGDGCQYLDVFFYQAIGDVEFINENDQLEFISKLGLQIPNYKVCNNALEVNLLWNQYQDSLREQLDYDIDGLVVRINNIEKQLSFGETNLRPNGAIAFKFSSEMKETIIKDIIWQVGNSGKVTPVAIIEPTKLMGAIITKASLYNIAYIEKLKLDIGATVLVCRANDVIPRVEQLVQGTGKILQPPERCPICNDILEMQGEFLICPNIMSCQAQICGRIKNWVNTLNLLEWGTALVERLLEENKISNIVDLYKLTIEDLASLQRMGEKSATKAYNILWENSSIKLERFLGGLSISMIGETVIGTIMDAGYDSLDKILNASIDDFEKISSIGPTKARALYNGLRYNKDIISGLLSAGVTIKERVFGKLTGLTFCLTGEMSHGRDELIEFIVENGGIVKSSVVKNLSYLVIADPNSQTVKAKTARKNGTKCISENQLFDLVEK